MSESVTKQGHEAATGALACVCPPLCFTICIGISKHKDAHTGNTHKHNSDVSQSP